MSNDTSVRSNVKIAPSLLSSDFADLKNEIEKVTHAGADWLHVDVMDGNFVPNLTLGMPIVKAMKPHAKIPLDVHLMIEKPERYIEQFIAAGSDYLTLHVESTDVLEESLKKIKSLGAKAGITLRPKTSLESIKPYLHLVDLVLVMTVEPGFGGQSFMSEQVQKIKDLKNWREENSANYLIEVDGGIAAGTAQTCIAAGADVLVAGSAVFKGEKTVENYRQNIQALK
ncbi:ribulose-phosphate 3-epimerase [Pseudobdellovibrio exovorus]|uniref:Ribulose-phosphate 3-epimerase n=1 Tax=Pseudobdellovibrio exovorus JSS TaxID=1184267 RepID=M4VA14_9BACT|nr:ribulose-phosphate 3-epimerase [Pseudobdellovibrio exovorus]AGH96038.1 ribulose-phosphate 3-epimerase [Pseudobdellovibrio exovorus JSS]